MSQRPLLWFYTVFFLSLFSLGCDQSPGTTTLTLLYTGNVNGELERCGCAEKQFGGVSRRKTVIDQHRTAASLLLDSGDIFFGSFENRIGSSEFFRTKAGAMIQAMNLMGYDAAMAGEYDFAEGQGWLMDRIDEAAFPFVCSNLSVSRGEQRVVPYRILERGNLRVALVAFLDNHVVTDSYKKALGELTLQDPFEAARNIIPEIQKKSDLLIALVHFSVMDVRKFLEAFPQIHVALLGHTAGEGIPERIADTVTVSGSSLGKALGKLVLEISPGKGVVNTRGIMIPISEELPADGSVEKYVENFNRTVREKRFSEDRSFIPASEPESGYAGAEQCLSCHPVIYQQWSVTPHAFAMETLEEKGYEYHPECVVCHVAGYLYPDGYSGREKTPHLEGVQCESCHGPGRNHLLGKPMKSGVPEEVCRNCHNEIHSPTFESYPYYNRSNQCKLL